MDPTVVRSGLLGGIVKWTEYTPEALVGETVAELRKARGWSQSELAQHLEPFGFDMHQTTIAKLEGGGRPIRINEAAAIAEVFGVRFMDLLPVPIEDDIVAAGHHRVLRAEQAAEAAKRRADAAVWSHQLAIRDSELADVELALAQTDYESLLRAHGIDHGQH